MRTAVTAGLAGVVAHIKQHPEVAVFSVGMILFAGGLASVISGQLSPNLDSKALEPAARLSASPKPGRVGPALNEPLRPYILGKRSLLTRRASQSPGVSTLAMIVFGSYRRMSEVETLINARNLEPVSIQVRVPLPVFRPVEMVLEDRTLAAAVSQHTASVRREHDALEDVAREVTDERFKVVYEKNLNLHREAMKLLRNDPAIIFAVVVESTYANLGGIDDVPQVRYVDIPEDPAATISNHTFAAPIPEDTETAGFALK